MARRLRIRRERQDGEENIVPLINIVFLLLIFFMLTGNLAPPEPFDIDPPASLSEAEAGERPVTVSVAADGRIALDGRQVEAAGLAADLKSRIEAAQRGTA